MDFNGTMGRACGSRLHRKCDLGSQKVLNKFIIIYGVYYSILRNIHVTCSARNVVFSALATIINNSNIDSIKISGFMANGPSILLFQCKIILFIVKYSSDYWNVQIILFCRRKSMIKCMIL